MNRSSHLKRSVPVQATDAQAVLNPRRGAGLNKPFIKLRRRDALDVGGWNQFSGSAAVVIPPWVIALDRWVDEGGAGDDPDDAAWLNPARMPDGSVMPVPDGVLQKTCSPPATPSIQLRSTPTGHAAWKDPS
ncbi:MULTISPECIES: hypothetical protein [unclassified Deinococcus]|uniref:hypothetical protein n=1 Tax=unclassified Deinococcus TaxID=2623546 RepID=UPI000A811595|nr:MULTISPECIES: hypothetical protein [unclassified Deinococcus]MCD0168199.1 hypothetical protein [Deinococcus sp. 23YEL01]